MSPTLAAALINWFTPNEMLTYGKPFNFVVGVRGGGKSVGALKYCISRYKKTGEHFIYMRRQEKDLDESLPTVFDVVKRHFFPNDDLYAKGNRLYCNGKVMGFAVALSTSMKRKSVNYDKVKTIIFEEFMVDGVTSRYLGHGDQECAIFENFYETVDRLRNNTRVIFIANTFSLANIYFMHYNVKLDLDEKSIPKRRYNVTGRAGLIMVCYWHDESYLAAKRQSDIYKLTEGTEYNRHAYGSEFTMDKRHFIKLRPADAEFNFAMAYMGKTYGVWCDWANGRYYVTSKAAGAGRARTVSLSLDDNRPNNVNIRRVKAMPFMRLFRKAVDENCVYYDCLETKAMLEEAVFLLKTIT